MWVKAKRLCVCVEGRFKGGVRVIKVKVRERWSGGVKVKTNW